MTVLPSAPLKLKFRPCHSIHELRLRAVLTPAPQGMEAVSEVRELRGTPASSHLRGTGQLSSQAQSSAYILCPPFAQETMLCGKVRPDVLSAKKVFSVPGLYIN